MYTCHWVRRWSWLRKCRRRQILTDADDNIKGDMGMKSKLHGLDLFELDWHGETFSLLLLNAEEIGI